MKYAFFIAEDYNPGAAYIMAYLRSQGHDVRLFFDPRQFNRGYARNSFLARLLDIQDWLVKEMKEYNPDVVCFSVISATYQWGLRLAERIKNDIPNVRIIFGGTMPTLIPDIVRKNKFIDTVVEGDGIRYFGGDFQPDVIWPARDDFFRELPVEHRKTQLFMTSYGCPFNCSYCGNQQLREVGHWKHLKRTVDGCIKELKYMKETWGMEKVLFVDDIFTVNKKWLLEFLPKYRQEIDLPFICFGHVNCMDEEMVAELARSKCDTIWIGIQSGEEGHRKQILNRNETNQQIIDACDIIKKHGIKLMVDHICGIPFENDIIHEISYSLYERINPDVINVYELLYFPKAKINEHALKCGYLTEKDIELINEGKHVVYQQGNKGKTFFDKYAKAIVAIPLKSAFAELLPMWMVKMMIHLRAGRLFILKVVIENEFFFTWNAILKKLGIKRHAQNYRNKSCV